jgi:hypothetical protein
MLSEASKRSKRGIRFVKIKDVVDKIGNPVAELLLVIHAWSGSGTVSATFGQGKGVLLRKVQKMDYAQDLVNIFMCENISCAEISQAGSDLFMLMYSGHRQGDTLQADFEVCAIYELYCCTYQVM